jgi:hypothetical protein
MKPLKYFLIGLALVAGITAQAQPTYKAFSGQGTRLSNNLENLVYYVAPARTGTLGLNTGPEPGPAPALDGPAVLDTLQVKYDTNAQSVQFLTVAPETNSQGATVVAGYPVFGTNGANGTTNIYLTPDPTFADTSQWWSPAESNAFANAGCAVLVRHVATETYERSRVLSLTFTNLIFSYPLQVATVKGDEIYPLATNGSIALFGGLAGGTVTNAAAQGSLGGIANGLYPKMPFDIEVVGGATNGNNAINLASGHYIP